MNKRETKISLFNMEKGIVICYNIGRMGGRKYA